MSWWIILWAISAGYLVVGAATAYLVNETSCRQKPTKRELAMLTLAWPRIFWMEMK